MDSSRPEAATQLESVQAAGSGGRQLVVVSVGNERDFDGIRDLVQQRAGALLVAPLRYSSAARSSRRAGCAPLAPGMFQFREFTAAGGS